jgi:4-hydroxy-4-methyl-2-oxoglutarate aldolase
MRVSEDILQRLRQFDTPTVCNVLELFEYRPRTTGYMDGRIRACFPQLPPMVGFATTANVPGRRSAPQW